MSGTAKGTRGKFDPRTPLKGHQPKDEVSRVTFSLVVDGVTTIRAHGMQCHAQGEGE